MDTSALSVDTLGTPYPIWTRDAVRRGVRIALELLRAPTLPMRVILHPDWLDTPVRPHTEPTVNRHTATEIVVSYPAVTSPYYLGDPPHPPEQVVQALAFCAGYAAARFTIDQVRFLGGAPWLADDVLADDAAREGSAATIASHVAAIASGFTMVASGTPLADHQSAAVGFFLERLAVIRHEEGPAALWRGALGKAVRALVKEVRFTTIPGRVNALGHRLPHPGEIHALLHYVEGAGPWPFPYPQPLTATGDSRAEA